MDLSSQDSSNSDSNSVRVFSLRGNRSSYRACDACRRRKTPCIRSSPGRCSKCIASSLSCTFNDPVLRRGPKKAHAQRLAATSNPLTPGEKEQTLQPEGNLSEEAAKKSDCILPQTLSRVQVTECLVVFFTRIQPEMPAMGVNWEYIHDMIDNYAEDCKSYCTILSLCAYTKLIQHRGDSGTMADVVDDEHALARSLVGAVRSARKCCEATVKPQLSAILVAALLSCAYARLEEANMAWHYLREATTLALSANLHQEEHYTSGPVRETMQERCLYWFLFIEERIMAIRAKQPVTLHSTIDRPSPRNCFVGKRQLVALNRLIALYEPFDMDAISAWCGWQASASFSLVVHLQEQIGNALIGAVSKPDSLTPDIYCSQAWLHILVWQFALRNGLLSSDTAYTALKFEFPVQVATTLASVLADHSSGPLLLHGTCMTERIFEVASSVVDVVISTPDPILQNMKKSFELVKYFVEIIDKLPRGTHEYVPYLESRLDEICAKHPCCNASS